MAIAGGSRGLTGAVRMASLAAIRAGAGYATVAVPADLEPVFEAGEPEVMSVGCPGGDGCLVPASAKTILRAFERAAAGVLGPGMGRDPGSVELAREIVGAIEAPLVIDADGLNAFAGQLGPIAAREGPTVLTPHAGELGRLLGRDSEEIEAHRLACAREAARAAGAVVVLKGDDTIVTDGERVAVNAISAPALATAGSGDVLSGITRRAARPRPGAVRGRLRRGRRPRPRRARRRRPHRRRRVGDRHRRDRLGPRGPASRPSRSNNLAGMKTAAEIMNADVPSVAPEDDARAAIDLLAKTDMGAVPVVDEDRKVVGIVSESDLILSDEESDLHLPHYLNIMGGIVFVGSMKGFEKRLEKAFATKVSELMTADPIVAHDYEAADRVAKKIADKHHNHLPVVDADGRLAGMVTRADALAALVDDD